VERSVIVFVAAGLFADAIFRCIGIQECLARSSRRSFLRKHPDRTCTGTPLRPVQPRRIEDLRRRMGNQQPARRPYGTHGIRVGWCSLADGARAECRRNRDELLCASFLQCESRRHAVVRLKTL